MAECSIDELMQEARCFSCVPTRILEVLQLQLLCEISQTGPSGLFLAQAANLSDVDDEAAARENLGVGLTDSPVFTGATLSGMTPGSVLFAGTGGALSQDNASFFFDDTTDALKLGARGTGLVVPTLNRLEAIRDITGGAAASNNATIYVETKVSGVNTGAAITSEYPVVSMTGGTAAALTAFGPLIYLTGGTVASTYGANIINFNLGGTVSNQYGLAGNSYVNAGSTTNVFGLQFGVSVTGTATTAYGADITLTGAGTITNGYGLYVRTPFSGTVNTALYGIFNEIGRASAIGMVIKGAAVQTGDLLQFQNSAGTVLTKVLAGGNVLTVDGTAAAPAWAFTSEPGFGFYRGGASILDISNSVASVFRFNTASLSGLTLANDLPFGWSSTGAASGARDIILSRAAAGKLSLSTGSAMYFPDGTAAAPSLAFASDPNTGLFSILGDKLALVAAGATVALIDNFHSTGLWLSSISALQWTSGAIGTTNTTDLALWRDAANTLAQRNGVNAQAFRVYNTFTSTTNYERGYVRWVGNNFEIGTEAGSGGGTNRDLLLRVPTSSEKIYLGNVAGTFDLLGIGGTIGIVAKANLTFGTDNTYDIGASGATRPRSIFAGTAFIGPGTVPAAGTLRLQDGDSIVWYKSTGASSVGMRVSNGALDFAAGGQYPASYSFRVESAVVGWSISTAGDLLAITDNTTDIGSSGANRPRSIFAATYVSAPEFEATAAGQFYFAARSRISSPADSQILLRNAAANNFSMLLLGGTTSAFPAIKRSGTILQARLADDSAYGTYQGILQVSVNATAGVVVATHTVPITDAAGQVYRVPCLV